MDNVKVYLIGHGYAPVFRVTDGAGRVVFDQAVPFIPVSISGFASEGVVKVPDAHPQQLGFAGVFLPTTVDYGGQLQSAFPAPYRPRVSLVSFAGNLGMNSGLPQSVYQLDTKGLHRLPVKPRPLAPGQSIKLPNGAGTLTFTGYRQWISLAITYDPGQLPALIAAIAALAGLLISFLVRRRRVFVRVASDAGGSTVEFGGLPRTESSETFEAEFAGLTTALAAATGATEITTDETAGETRGPPHQSAPQQRTRGSEPVSVNMGLAQLSDHFLLATVVLYALGMLAFACDFAYGRSTRQRSATPGKTAGAGAVAEGVADPARVAVPAGVTASAGGAPPASPAAQAASVPPALRPGVGPVRAPPGPWRPAAGGPGVLRPDRGSGRHSPSPCSGSSPTSLGSSPVGSPSTGSRGATCTSSSRPSPALP